MTEIHELNRKEIVELLTKGWMTHDAMWFFHCMQKFGIEQTNELNIAAIHSMAAIEIKRFLKAIKMDSIKSFEDLKNFSLCGFWQVKPDFMKMEVTFPEKNHMKWEMNHCFAYDGISRLGLIEQYKCGIFERIKAWFNTLGIKYTITPDEFACTMHREGKCSRDFNFYFA